MPGKKPPSQHEPLREETRWAPEDEDALDRLLRSDFAARVWKFRETGSGVSLDEVPAVLSQLLDLNSAELERLTAILGFRAKDLRHPNGLLIGRITADRVVRMLAGEGVGGSKGLPTTVREVDRRLAALRQNPADPDGPGSAERDAEARQLTALRRGLAAISRNRGLNEIGGVLGLTLNAGRTADTLKKWGKYSVGLGPYLNVAEADRRTGKRHVSLSLETGLNSFFVGGNVVVKGNLSSGVADANTNRVQTGRGAWVKAPVPLGGDRKAGVSYGYSPIFGRHFSVSNPMKYTVVMGERYVGLALYPWGILPRRLKLFGRWTHELSPSLVMGVRGDPVAHVMGPLIRWAYEGFGPIRRRVKPLTERPAFEALRQRVTDWRHRVDRAGAGLKKPAPPEPNPEMKPSEWFLEVSRELDSSPIEPKPSPHIPALSAIAEATFGSGPNSSSDARSDEA